MKHSKKVFRYLFVLLTLMSACNRHEIYKGGEDSGNDKESIFDFSTKQSVELKLAYKVPGNFRGMFEAYTQNPFYVDEYQNCLKKEGVKPFMVGYTKADGTVDFPLELPAYVPEVYIYSPSIGLPSLMSAKIENGEVVPVETAVAATKATRATTKPYYTAWKSQTLSWKKLADWGTEGKPGNLWNEKLTLGAKDLEIINATIPDEKSIDMRFASVDIVSLSEDAHVNLYYVSRGLSNRVNALAYYVYEGDNHPAQDWVNKNLIMLYPKLNEDVLNAGDGIRLKYFNKTSGQFEEKFPAGSKIGMVLLVDAWKGEGQIASKTNVMYSWHKFNSYTITNVSVMADRPQMAMFKTEDKVILSFEDQPWTERPNSPYQGNFRDNVFVLDVDPIEALPDEIPDGQKPDEPNGEAVYSKNGILAFEDVWPYKGDYDMNDVVVGYKSSAYCDRDWMITGTIDTFVFLNHGAQYENGFGYEMGINRTDVEKIEIISDYQCNGQGLDPSLDKATIMLFDNGKNVPVNTRFIVKIWLKQPTSTFYGYTLAPYNPFITIGNFMGNERKELHLVNYAPTSKADMNLLGYGHDLSDPAKGIYYVSDADYPFALDLSGLEVYQVPAEAQRIDQMYPQFDGWVTSGKKDYTDWYLHPAK